MVQRSFTSVVSSRRVWVIFVVLALMSLQGSMFTAQGSFGDDAFCFQFARYAGSHLLAVGVSDVDLPAW